MSFKRIERMIKVTDDWCPNYPNNEVKLCLTLATYNGHCPYIILSAWGFDDLGVEKIYEADTKEMLKEYKEIPNFVCYEWFLQHGFKKA